MSGTKFCSILPLHIKTDVAQDMHSHHKSKTCDALVKTISVWGFSSDKGKILSFCTRDLSLKPRWGQDGFFV